MKAAEKERRKRIATLEKEAVNILNGIAAVVYRKFVRYHFFNTITVIVGNV